MKLSFVITIIDKNKKKTASKLYKEACISSPLIMHGRGTASSEIKDYLGIDSPEKDIFMGIASEPNTQYLFSRLENKLELSKPGHGIAFTVPLSAISEFMANEISSKESNVMEKLNDENINTPENSSYEKELIIALVDVDDSDIIIEAARSVGCKGGTITRTRDASNENVKKVFGITLQGEKDVLMMIVPKENKHIVLKTICNTYLEKTGEHCIAFSVPVTEAIGLK